VVLLYKPYRKKDLAEKIRQVPDGRGADKFGTRAANAAQKARHAALASRARKTPQV
jgi:hypothetical protein